MSTSSNQSSGVEITANEEVRLLPKGWGMKGRGASNRVAFYRPGGSADKDGTFDHPVLGPLPAPWELRKQGPGQFVYHDTKTGYTVRAGPRKVSRRPVGAIAVRSSGHGKLRRQATSPHPLHYEYDRVKCIDDGQGLIGGMNDGIYIVRSKTTAQLFVEKNYNGAVPHLTTLVKSEINMMKKLIHGSIIHYVASFVQNNPFRATVYMEFCDRGSMRDLILAYKARKKAREPDFVPESFIWHAFLGLADALGFLATGRSCVAMSLSLDKNSKNAPIRRRGRNYQGKPAGSGSWMPVIHRDIKPDNIFLRSRDTPGSTKPFYVLLSDFGLAQYELEALPPDPPGVQPGDPGAQLHGLVGSIEHHAPELAFDPYPSGKVVYQGVQQTSLQAGPHTAKSDVWAAACVVFGLCERDDLAHLDRNCFPLRSERARGRAAKRPVLELSDKSVYSEYLERTLAWAAAQDPADRPDPWLLVNTVREQRDLWVADPNWKAQVDVGGVLPSWATKQQTV